MREVVGRDTELRAVDALLESAADGLAPMLIRGEAGIGKTTVWAEATRRGQELGFRVLTARAAAAEAPLTLASLADLLESIDEEELAALPGPQRVAIDAALLRAAPAADSIQPRLLGTAVRTLLGGLAGRRPLLVAVDDVQWMDPASADVLAYALRRLSGAPIAVILAQRSGEPARLDISALAEAERRATLDLGPLTVAALHHLLKDRTGVSPSRSTLIRIHEAAGGSPLFALEIARVLDAGGAPPSGEPLPVPADVRTLVRGRVRELPAPTRQLLLLAAAHGRAPVGLLETALGHPIETDLEPAERGQIAAELDGRVAFLHPLYAAAILGESKPADRRDAHARLAGALDVPEERARHRALAAVGPDASVADELEAVARAADARAAPGGAADLFQLAVELTPPTETDVRDGRRIEQAGSLQRGGDSSRAAAILEAVAAESPSPAIRARARLALAAIRYETSQSAIAVELAEQAVADARASGDLSLVVRALASLSAVDWDDYPRRTANLAEAERLLDDVADPDPSLVGLVMMESCGTDLDLGRALDPVKVERGLEAERLAPPRNVSERFSAALGSWLKHLDRFDEARHWIEATRHAAIDEGDEGSLPYAVSHLPELEVWSGHWDRARQAAEEHLALAIELGLEAQRRQAVYNLALVDVHEGREAEARAEIDEALAAARADGDAWTESSVEPLLALLELSLGRSGPAAALLRHSTEIREAMGQDTPRRADPDLVEALLAVGDMGAARAAERRIGERARRFGIHSAMANALRARAMVEAADGDLDGAIAAADEALVEHGLGRIPFDEARTHLLLGQLRRRRRERTAAKAEFESALGTFRSLGARLWADRARAELERVGLRRASADELTDGERRVAELAAKGLTNREVAAALFLSPKTVEANLARAYAKLGIQSRAELGALLSTRATEALPQT